MIFFRSQNTIEKTAPLEHRAFSRLLQLAVLGKLHLVPESDQNLLNPHIAIPLLWQTVDLAKVDLASFGIDASHIDLRHEFDLRWRGGVGFRTIDP